MLDPAQGQCVQPSQPGIAGMPMWVFTFQQFRRIFRPQAQVSQHPKMSKSGLNDSTKLQSSAWLSTTLVSIDGQALNLISKSQPLYCSDIVIARGHLFSVDCTRCHICHFMSLLRLAEHFLSKTEISVHGLHEFCIWQCQAIDFPRHKSLRAKEDKGLSEV